MKGFICMHTHKDIQKICAHTLYDLLNQTIHPYLSLEIVTPIFDNTLWGPLII